MKTNTKFHHRCLSTFCGLALAGSATLGLAQQTNNPNNFDASASTASWIVWWGPPNPSITWDGTRDAANNPNSGSMRYVENFSGVAAQQFMTFGTFGNQGAWDGSVAIDGTLYTNLSFDIKVEPGTPTDIYGDYGNLENGFVTQGSWGTIYLPTYTIPASATNWTHVVRPIDPTAAGLDKIAGVFLKMWSNGAHTNALTFNVDNVYVEPKVNAAPPPPPTLRLDPTTPGLQLITTTSAGANGRQSIHTADPNYSWVNATTSVTYSVTIKDYAANANPNFQTHIFLCPAASIPYGPGDSAVDWNSTNLVFIQIQNTGSGAGNATFMYKTNVTSSTDRWSGQIFGSNTLGTVHSATIKGTWSLTFNNNTNVQMSAPDGSVTNFFMPEASALLFAGPLYAWFGVQANGSANVGQEAVFSRLQIIGGVSPEIDDNFPGPGLNSANWALAAQDSAGIQVVTSDTPLWLSWNLPDTGFNLQFSADLASGSWSDPGLTTVQIGPRRRVLIPPAVIGSTQAYFRLLKVVP